jgi:hypothetical protein
VISLSDGRWRGTVVSFDAQVGLGVVEAGGVQYPFHCTQIADGSREIAVATPVEFGLIAGRLGRTEAAWLTQPG